MDPHFSPQQSLQLIQSMIDRAKSDLSEKRFYFLLWGWVTFTAITGQFLLKVIVHSPYHAAVWWLILPAAVASILFSVRTNRKERVKTYVGESMANLWTGIGISFFVLSVLISSSIGWEHAYPFFILFYGLGTFVSGRFLQFPPLVMGGIFNWVLAIACVFVPYDYQLLIAATAILTSYIIPGHLLATRKR